MSKLPHLSTDQVAAFVELSRAGQIRSTAETLGITEQGVRNRLVALEAQLGVELYRKSRGPRRATILTPQGQQFLPHALAFLERAHELCRACDVDTGQRQLRVVASQYLTRYVLIDVLEGLARCRALGARAGQHDARIRSDQRARERPEVAFGLAAPYESTPELDYHDLFAMNWSVVAPAGHPLTSKKRVSLSQVVKHPLVLYERGFDGPAACARRLSRRSI